MMRAFLLAAAATVASALTPAQADLLLSLQGRLQELNVSSATSSEAQLAPARRMSVPYAVHSLSSSRRCTRSSMTTAPARSPSTR